MVNSLRVGGVVSTVLYVRLAAECALFVERVP